MIKLFFIGGGELVVDVASTNGLEQLLGDPNAVLDVNHDGHRLLVPVRAVAGIALLRG